MTKLIHAFYNMDTNSVELTYNDGSVLTIDCEKVENHYDVTNGQMADLDWLLYNAAMEYAMQPVQSIPCWRVLTVCWTSKAGQTVRLKNIKTQRQTYCAEEKELTKSEYLRLLEAAKDRPQLHLILETICGTGIRVSELRFFNAEAVKRGEITVSCKSKTRTILLPGKLKKMLLDHAKKKRHPFWSDLYYQEREAVGPEQYLGADEIPLRGSRSKASKVFPHNLRKLFARTFYGIEKGIAKLADILGHSSIDTTRIYIMTTGTEHRRKIERLGLVV